jgi:hypothetical protein
MTQSTHLNYILVASLQNIGLLVFLNVYKLGCINKHQVNVKNEI